MNREKKSRLIRLFLRDNRHSIIFFGIMASINPPVFLLYELPLEPFFYTTAICFLAGGVILILRFGHFMKRHREMQKILQSIDTSYKHLPPARTMPEADYQDMIRELGRQCKDMATSLRIERKESIDYYTTWVHQIKTPIAAMHLILQNEDSPLSRSLKLELIRIEQYVGMVLGYIRLGDDSSDLSLRICKLDDIIRQIIRRYASIFIQKKNKLEYNPVEKTLLTDEKWLMFIIEQLVSNAVKYTNEGVIKIYMQGDDELIIQDTGIGIAPEDLPRIFEKGFTGYNGRADKKSTGLGLYLCKKAAHKISISIKCDSKVGVGTTFTLGFSQYEISGE